ncbi:MAG: cupredoxin family copper-binding protein [Xanthobacteraceae bacterium]|nr:cupredoxin family copper-binding protein [Xanthobacteraceae bacterium]MBY0612996.1 cupredoxin family copper-binding protein [Beijerinckiaceae bacterium]
MFQKSLSILVMAVAVGASFAPWLQAQTPSPANHAVAIQSFAFGPVRVEIKAGDSVQWTNKDFAPHTATADDEGWSSSELKNGASDSIVFKTAGSFAYHCKYHPQMKGVIVVRD